MYLYLSRLSRGTGGTSGKRQVTADMSDIRKSALLLSSNFFYVSLKGPFNKKYRYLTEARQFYSALVFGIRLSKSGQHHSRLADNDN